MSPGIKKGNQYTKHEKDVNKEIVLEKRDLYKKIKEGECFQNEKED